MRWLPGPHQRIYANYLKLAKFVGERLEMNRQTLDPNSPRDFINCFLIKIQQVSPWPLPGSAKRGRGFLPDPHAQDSSEEATRLLHLHLGSCTQGRAAALALLGPQGGSCWGTARLSLRFPGPARKAHRCGQMGWALISKPSKQDPSASVSQLASLRPCLKNQSRLVSAALQEKGHASSHFNEDTMSKTTINLFFAGTETVSSTLRYGLRILLRHPEMEGKLGEGAEEGGAL